MTINALLLGSIGVVTETSDMQRRAFNDAFSAAGLDWTWDRDEYARLLKSSGGAKRIAAYAEARGATVDAEALHADKVARFSRMMADEGLTLRPGIRDLLDEAANRALPVAWVTDTGEAQLSAIFEALGPALHAEEFAWIGAGRRIANRKPAPDIYRAALADLQVGADEAIAVEDTGICAKAARAAGLRTFGWPNAYADRADFPEGVHLVDDVAHLLDHVAEPTG
jgi:beta-phosphoglucomutase-like phosphatase (HAD superfamily)